MTTEIPKTIYHLILQDNGRDGTVVADILSSSPFPRLETGDSLTVEETQPRVWDIKYSMTRVAYSSNRKELHIITGLMVDSPCERLPMTEIPLMTF